MTKTVLIPLWCLLVLLQTFPKSLLVLDYFINTAKYEALCVNKERPDMNCHGLCQLDKKLQKVDHSHSHSQRVKVEFSVVYLPAQVLTLPVIIHIFDRLNFPPILSKKTQKQPVSLLKPPKYFS